MHGNWYLCMEFFFSMSFWDSLIYAYRVPIESRQHLFFFFFHVEEVLLGGRDKMAAEKEEERRENTRQHILGLPF